MHYKGKTQLLLLTSTAHSINSSALVLPVNSLMFERGGTTSGSAKLIIFRRQRIQATTQTSKQ